MTKSGTTATWSDGSNTFNGATSLTNSSTAQWRLANTTGDIYNASLTLVQTSSGAMSPAYSATSRFSGSITINSATAITFGSNTGIVQFEGNTAQTITSASSIPTIQRLVMNKPSNTLTLNTPVNIGVSGTFTSGIIQSTATNYLHFIAGSTVSGGSNASHTDGPVRKTGNTAFSFPVGDNAVFRTIAMDAPGTITDQFTAEYVKAAQAYGNYTTFDPSYSTLSSCEYWTLDRTNGTSNVNVTLSWNTTDCGAGYITDLTSLRVSRWNGSAWADHGNGGTTGTAASGTIVTSAAVSSFSPFALASTLPSNTLPVELAAFGAVVNGKQVDLSWSTESENNNAYFTIEKSVDNNSFEVLTTVQSVRNSHETTNYSASDMFPPNGVSYYRLRQTDNNGESRYLETVSVKIDLSEEPPFYAWPNPSAGDYIMLYVNNVPVRELTASILDLSGKIMHSETVPNEDNRDFVGQIRPTNKLSPGVYLIVLQTENHTYTQKLVVSSQN